MNDPNSAPGIRMLHPQNSPDFLDDKLEWRRLFAETWGTFLLVLSLQELM